jgi:hypothetical protein
MSEFNLNADSHICIGFIVATAEIERTIVHMEADIAFHHSQTRMFEKMLKDEQKKLEDLVSNHDHSSCGEESSEFDSKDSTSGRLS